jgi:predicted transposase YdaD
MTSHDAHLKQLLRTFFREFLQAFVPEVGRELKPGSIEFLDKELLRTAGHKPRMRVVDLVAKVAFRDQPGFVLVHVEHQSSRRAEVRRRMFAYAGRLMEEHGLPVYPILLTSYDRPRDKEPDRYVVEARGLKVVDFRFRVVQLNRLNWRDFLRTRNPAATALMAKMKIAPADRPKVRVQILRLLTQLRLDRRKLDLVAGFVDTYLSLTSKDFVAFRRELDRIEDRQQKHKVMELITQWERKGRKEGRQEGRQEGELTVLARQLKRRFGALPIPLEQRIKALSLKELESLAEALLDFEKLEDLEAWLAVDKQGR